MKGNRKPVLIIGAALALLLVALVLVLGTRQADRPVEGNLIKNGDFSVIRDQHPEDWEEGMWVTSPGTSYLEAVTLEDGTTAALIENAGLNDARFEQTVTLRENTTYRLSARARAEGCGSGIGANLSFMGIFGTSREVHDTRGEWEELALYARTGAGQKEATVAVRLGGYGSENTGKAWFTDVVLEEVSEVPVGELVLNLKTPEPAKEDKERGGTDLKQISIPMLLAAAGGYLLLAVLWLRTRGQRASGSGRGVAALLLLAAAIRVVLSFTVPGYGVDIGCFSAWAGKMASGGPAHFYEEGYFCDYPPAYMLVLGVIGQLVRLLGIGYSSMGIQVLLKSVPILCDLALAWLFYRLTRRRTLAGGGIFLCAVVAFNPALIITGSCWGQIDVITGLLLVLILLQADRQRYDIAIPLFALAVLTKPQAGLLAPLGMVALIMTLVKDRGQLRRVLVGILLGIAVTLVIVVPFSLNQTSATWLFDKYLETLSSYDYSTLSTGNLMFLLGGNWVKNTEVLLWGITYGQAGYALMALSFAAGIALLLRGGLRRLILSAALTLQMIFVLGPKMHERYILPGLIVLLLAYVREEDVRLLFAFLLASAAAAVNIGVVLAFDYLIAPNLWLGYVLGALQLLSLGITVWTAVDLCRGKDPVRPPEKVRTTPREEVYGQSRDEHLRGQILSPSESRVRVSMLDLGIMACLMVLYGSIAVYNLGSTTAPQTGYVSSADNETVVLDLGGVREDFMIYYYGGISDTKFAFEISDDGENYTDEAEAYFDRGTCFKWQAVRLAEYDENDDVIGYSGSALTFSGRYIRIRFHGAGSALWEVAAVNEKGVPYPIHAVSVKGGVEGRTGDPSVLVDEQETVPDRPSYLNSMYFDEIYHARTGYEHAHALPTYETTHPPLGKVFMSLCIRLLGMTPFAWRLAGTLAGILMIPVIYLMGLSLLRRTRWAALSAVLLTADCMHFTQTRIATIDSFGVLFIMLMFLFMIRWLQMSPWRDSQGHMHRELLLCGICTGLAISSKWIGCYGAVGIAVLFFARMWQLLCQARYAQAHRNEDPRFARVADGFAPFALQTLGMCIVYFVVIPVIIYCLSYIPYLEAYGEVRLNGRTIERLISAQTLMFDYHAGLQATHYFASPWYEWPLIIKPMWYYQADFPLPGKMSTILSFGNPAVWWTGLVAMCLVMALFVRSYLLTPEGRRAGERSFEERALPVLVVGFLSAYLPWVLVSRLTFIYHYFASVPFIILSTSTCLCHLERRFPRVSHVLMAVLMVAAVVLFAAFYPLASGCEVSREWGDAMNWFRGWMWY